MELYDIAQKALAIKGWPEIWKEFMNVFVIINNATSFSSDKVEAIKQLDNNYDRALQIYLQQIDSEILYTNLLRLAEAKGVDLNTVHDALISRFSQLNQESRKPRDVVDAMTILRENWKKALEELYSLLKNGELNARTAYSGDEHA
ncbi:MAG: hypothetical protein ACP5GS_08455 [Nitrososphaeria archaeon]